MSNYSDILNEETYKTVEQGAAGPGSRNSEQGDGRRWRKNEE